MVLHVAAVECRLDSTQTLELNMASLTSCETIEKAEEDEAASKDTSASSGDVPFSVGETFSNYDDLSSKITRFERKNFVKLWKRDSRSVEAASKRLNRDLSDKIKYYEVTFCCIHGGKKFKAKGEGLRTTK